MYTRCAQLLIRRKQFHQLVKLYKLSYISSEYFFLEKVVCPLSVPQTDEPLGLTEIKFQIFRTFEFSPRSESSIRESYVFRRSTCAGHNVKDANGCDMLRCGCEMRMGVRVAAGARCAGRNVKE